MGVAGSKASEVDESNAQSTITIARHLSASGPNSLQGTKRRRADEEALTQSLKRRKPTEISGGHRQIDLPYCSPRSVQTSGTDRVHYEGGVPPAIISGFPTAEALPTNCSIPSVEQSRLEHGDPNMTTSGRVAELDQAIIASPRFQNAIRSLREASEEVPSGWAVSAAPPISQSQRSHNLAMIRKAIGSLNGVHLTSTYSRDNLQLSTTQMPLHNTASRSRVSRRASLRPCELAGIQRRSRIVHKTDPIPPALNTSKRLHVDETVDVDRSRKRMRKALDGSAQTHRTKQPGCKLVGLWRKDDWSGWSGLLRTEF